MGGSTWLSCDRNSKPKTKTVRITFTPFSPMLSLSLSNVIGGSIVFNFIHCPAASSSYEQSSIRGLEAGLILS